MITNYSVNKSNPSFGTFFFLGNSDKILKKYGPKTIKKFEKLNAQENKYLRSIEIDHDGGAFIANYYGHWVRQKIFQTPIMFLKSVMKKADTEGIKEEIKKLEIANQKLKEFKNY